ncbi:MAG: peptidyl-prolyl cis-trans isomerase, partial [Candidatus Poribacteria bacterium]|nr:peptidyl-prolyl cis-trans isomerase [Candidatus Poribacteria bacterium]
MNEIWKRIGLNALAAVALISGSACGSKAAPAVDGAMTTNAAMMTDGVVLAEFEWGGKHHQITLDQLEREISELPGYRKDDYDGNTGREEYLTLMAESRMLLERARDLKLDTDATINRQVENHHRDEMIKKIDDYEIDQQVSVTDDEVAAYFDGHQEDYVVPEQVRLTAITLEDQAKVEEALQQIKSGERTIEEIAIGYSEQGLNVGPGGREDGNTGFFGKNDFTGAETFSEKAFSMQPGEVTDEVFTLDRMGRKYYMIWRNEERNEPRQQTFDEVEATVRRTVERQKRTERQDFWHAQLKQTARLELFEDRVPEPPATEEGSSETPTVTPQPELVLATYAWDGKEYNYTHADLVNVYEGLAKYRKTRFKTQADWVQLLDEELLEELKLREAAQLGYGQEEAHQQQLVEYRHQLMVEALVNREVDGALNLTEADYEAYFNEHREEYVEDEQVRLICLTFDNLEEAQAMIGEVKGGRDIAEAAQTLSEMGKNLG